MRLIYVILMLFGFSASGADLNLSPSSLKLTVYKMAVSSSPLCTNLTTVIDNGTSPSEVEFVGGVSLGSGTIANGTYSCIVIEMASYIKFTPSTTSTSTNCQAATENTLDVCSSGSSVLIDGTTTTCAASTNNRVAMYLSTASTSTTGSDAFNAPTSTSDATKGFNLGSALTVSATASGTFVVNPANKVCDDNANGCDGGGGGTGVGTGSCKLAPPTFSFSN